MSNIKKISIIVPTFNEQNNVHMIYNTIHNALTKVAWEIIFVDDASTDSTVKKIVTLSQSKPNIRLIRRYGRRGLSSACIEGMLSSTAQYIAVIDADGQHDETLLNQMVNNLDENASLDLIIGSRYCKGASLGTLAKSRAKISQLATKFSQLFYTTQLTDPMSGFFMIRATKLNKLAPSLSGIGYKILLDIIMTAKNNINIKELPYNMRSRTSGQSKLDVKVTYEYFLLIAEKTVGQYIPVRLLMFLMVGASGVLVQLWFTWIFHIIAKFDFVIANSCATYLAMSSNFILNNQFTYKDKKLRGRKLLKGYISFTLACSIGAVINISVAKIIFQTTELWWIAGISGAIFGSIWNYTMSNIITWKQK